MFHPKHPSRATRLGACLIGCLLAGCQSAPKVAGPTTKPFDLSSVIRADERLPVVNLDVISMSVPRGAVSNSGEFWKRIDEQKIDPATYDLLLKNGVRVGIGSDADWSDYFRDVFERNNARASRGSVLAGGSGEVDLSMKKDIKEQDLFYLNARNALYGQLYRGCENLLAISFWPEPRQVGALHLSISPTVRATRSHWEVKRNGEETEIIDVRPEVLFDLNLTTVIPPKGFLVVGPSPQAHWPSSLGNAFLTGMVQGEARETVLVLVPRNIRQGDPMLRSAPPVPPVAEQTGMAP